MTMTSGSKNKEKIYDCLVIGGGPAGYVAAIRAAQLGMTTAVVEREHLGGVCLNWGCIPTKSLLRTAEVAHILKMAPDFGFVEAAPPSLDLAKAVQRSRDTSKKLAKGIEYLLKKNKIEHIFGHAKLEGRASDNAPVRVAVEGQEGASKTLLAKHVILATGSRARVLPDLGHDQGHLEGDGNSTYKDHIWTAREAMIPPRMPGSLVIIGSGAIGIEFASFYKDIGVPSVTVVEMQDRILPSEDPEVSAMAQKLFEKQGIDVHTSATVSDIKVDDTGVHYTLKKGDESTENHADVLLMAIGIIGNTENLGLESTNIRVDRGHIVTHAFGVTDEPGIYAIGDVAGPPWLAHKGSHEGIQCIDHIMGLATHPMDPTKIPGCTFSSPQIASVGYTEPSAKEAGYEIKVGRFAFGANGKAQALGDSEGFVKVIFDAATGELLGAHMIGPEVTEMIQGFVIARTLEATEADLMKVVFPHPTLSECMHEAILDAYERGIHG